MISDFKTKEKSIMSLNNTPSSERIHIGIFGSRNAGKSSLINALTAQNIAIVSDVLGTTTDPVFKAMELLPLGPVVIIDTPGLDDEGELGKMRIKKALEVLDKTDIAVLVVDTLKGMEETDKELIEKFKEKNIPYVIAFNKSDLSEDKKPEENVLYVSAKTGKNIDALKEKIALLKPQNEEKRLVADLIGAGDIVVLVTPIDESAPKGRLILPQQQTIRDILDSGAISVVCREHELEATLSALSKAPALVITDSQAFKLVDSIVPSTIALTSFSILFARKKGDLKTLSDGAEAIQKLKDGDTVLLCEGCTHHRQCGDIGTVKLPNWIKKFTRKDLNFEFTSGTEFPEDLSKYALIIHCGGCMLNEKAVKARMEKAKMQNVPITNYGTAIAFVNGILKRSIEMFDM